MKCDIFRYLPRSECVNCRRHMRVNISNFVFIGNRQRVSCFLLVGRPMESLHRLISFRIPRWVRKKNLKQPIYHRREKLIFPQICHKSRGLSRLTCVYSFEPRLNGVNLLTFASRQLWSSAFEFKKEVPRMIVPSGRQIATNLAACARLWLSGCPVAGQMILRYLGLQIVT